MVNLIEYNYQWNAIKDLSKYQLPGKPLNQAWAQMNHVLKINCTHSYSVALLDAMRLRDVFGMAAGALFVVVYDDQNHMLAAGGYKMPPEKCH